MNLSVFGIILGGILLIPVLFAGDKSERLPSMSGRVCRIVLLLLFSAFAFLLFYKADEIPIPYHVDEAGMVYDAKSLAEYGTDRWGYRYPVYLINYGGGQSALYMYLAAAALRIFGYSVMTVRLPAIILSLLSALVFALMIRREYGNTASAAAMAVFCFLPFSVMHSRWGLDAYLLFPMLVFSCSAFVRAVRTGRIKWFLLSGILFGISFYTYAVSYILIPLFLASMSSYLLISGNIRFRQLTALWIPPVLLAVPLVLLLCVNNGLIEEIRTPLFSVPKLFAYRGSEFSFGNIIRNLEFGENNIFYSIFVWDSLRYNIIPEFGSMYYFTLPLIVYGLIRCIRRCVSGIRERKFSPDILFVFLFLSVFIIQLLLPYSNVNRACAVYFPLIFFLAAAVTTIIQKSRVSAAGTAVLFLFFGVCFIRYYFTDFPRELIYELPLTSVTELKEALDFAEEKNSSHGPVTVYGLSQSYLYTMLVKDIDPAAFNETKTMDRLNVTSVGDYLFDIGEVSPERVYLLRTHGWVPYEIREQPFQTADFGTITVYYP